MFNRIVIACKRNSFNIGPVTVYILSAVNAYVSNSLIIFILNSFIIGRVKIHGHPALAEGRRAFVSVCINLSREKNDVGQLAFIINIGSIKIKHGSFVPWVDRSLLVSCRRKSNLISIIPNPEICRSCIVHNLVGGINMGNSSIKVSAEFFKIYIITMNLSKLIIGFLVTVGTS